MTNGTHSTTNKKYTAKRKAKTPIKKKKYTAKKKK